LQARGRTFVFCAQLCSEWIVSFKTLVTTMRSAQVEVLAHAFLAVHVYARVIIIIIPTIEIIHFIFQIHGLHQLMSGHVDSLC